MHIQSSQLLDNGVTVTHHVARSSNFDLDLKQITIVVDSYTTTEAAATCSPVTTQFVHISYNPEAISALLAALNGNLLAAVYAALVDHKFPDGEIIAD